MSTVSRVAVPSSDPPSWVVWVGVVGDLAGGVGVGVCGCGWGWSGMMGGLFAAVCGPSPVRGRGW